MTLSSLYNITSIDYPKIMQRYKKNLRYANFSATFLS